MMACICLCGTTAFKYCFRFKFTGCYGEVFKERHGEKGYFSDALYQRNIFIQSTVPLIVYSIVQMLKTHLFQCVFSKSCRPIKNIVNNCLLLHQQLPPFI